MKNKFFIKTLSVVIIIFLLITTSINDFAYAISITSSMQANVTNTASLKDFNINNNIVSYNSGKITSAINCNSDTVVINIQDFHCNPSVQKNISDILSTLVEKYNIKSVYVEGGYGNINTKWLSDIKDENIKTQLIKVLLENGSLTGTEYFSAINPSSNISIYGIEKESVYKENFERLQNIFSNRSRYERIIKAFEKDLNFLQNKYFSSENKKFNKVLNKYKNGQIETRKYYKILFKYIQKYKNPTNNDIYGTILPIKIEDYPNIYTYMTLSEYEKKIKFTKITVELKKLLTTLKNNISYEQYNSIIKGTNNLKDITELVSVLSKLPEDFKNTNFSLEIKNFIKYVEISKQINPVELVEEERILVENIRLALSNNETEFDISFISDFFNCFIDYLNTSITASNYKYFSSKFDKFKILWDKYTYYNQLNNYKKEFDILDAYYKTNVQRDRLFLENIKQKDILISGTDGKKDNNYANILEQAKNIIVIITGGFHTEGLKNIITKNNISYIVITPNIKGNTDFANNRYAELLQIPLIDISRQSFQLPLLSNAERVQIVYEGLKQLNIEPTQENIENLNNTANEIIGNLTGNKTKYNNLFETDGDIININETKFSEIQNLLRDTIKEGINFINPKNYADETFAFMEKFVSDSNGMIWEISQFDNSVIEQLRNIGYSEYLPEFLQYAYFNIGNNLLSDNEKTKEYDFSANNCPFMIKFPSGKIVVILRETENVFGGFFDETYYVIDQDFSWDTPEKLKNKKDVIDYLEKQTYAKDEKGNSVIGFKHKKDSIFKNKIFFTANADVEFINISPNNRNLQIYDTNSSYVKRKTDKDLMPLFNELGNNNNKYDENVNMLNASDIKNINNLDNNQLVFVCLQDYSNAEFDKKKRIEKYVEYAVKNNKPIIIYPNLYVNSDELSNADLNYLFRILASKIVDFSQFYISTVNPYIVESPDLKDINKYRRKKFANDLQDLLTFSVKEILKNAFVHGNISELNKPIVVNFDRNNPQIDVLNINSNKKEDIYIKLLTLSNSLIGFGKGIIDINEDFEDFIDKYKEYVKISKWKYYDNFKDKNRTVSRATLKLNNKETKKNNIIKYKGNSFIFKKSEEELFFVVYINGQWFIQVTNNKIDKTQSNRFFPFAYGLDIKKRKDYTTIRKTREMTDYKSIIPVTDFSSIQFINITFGELSKKYFKEEKQNINIKNNTDENIFLEDFMRNDQNKIMDIWSKIDKNIKEGKTITIYPLRAYNNTNVINELVEQDYDKFIQLYTMLNSVIIKFCDNYCNKFFDDKKFDNFEEEKKKALKKELRYALIEMIRNAIVNGNHLDLSKPVTLDFDKESLNILNEHSSEKTNSVLQHLAAIAGLSGFGEGIENMSDKDNFFKYADNFKETNRTVSCASLNLYGKETFTGKYYNIQDTVFMIELPNTEEYDAKYVYVEKINGELAVTVVDNKDKLKDKNNQIIYLKKHLEKYGIENFKENNGYFEIKFKAGVKIFNLAEKNLKFEETLRDKQNQIQFADAVKQKRTFFDSLGIDTSKEIINISNENLKQIKNIEDKIIVFSLQNFNENDNENKLIDDNIKYCLQNNISVIIYPCLNKNIVNMNYADLRKLFLTTEKKLSKFSYFYGEAIAKNWKAHQNFEKYIRLSFWEILKNAVVHGNNADLILPIVVKPTKDKVEVINDNTQNKKTANDENFNLLQKFFAVIGKLHGRGLGIEAMKNIEEMLIYSDNNIRKTQNDDLWIASIDKNKKFGDFYFEQDIKDEIKAEMKTKIDIEDDMVDFFMEDIISVSDEELLKTLKGNKSEILKMLLEELDKTVFKLSAQSDIKTKIDKIQFVIETTDGNCVSFGNNGIVADNANYFSFAEPLEEDTVKNLIAKVKNIHVVFRDRQEYENYKEQFERNVKNSNNDEFKKRLYKNYPTVETIKKIGFDDGSFTALRLDEFIKDKEQFKQNLIKDLQNGKLVALFPFANTEISADANISSNLYIREDFFREISVFLVEQTIGKKYKEQAYIKYFADDVLEIFKNVFVHGNNISLDKPIYLYIKDDRLYISNVVDKENSASNYQKTLAVLSGLTGAHLGSKQIKNNIELEYQNSDIDKLKTGDIFENSIKVGDVSNVVYNGPAATSFVVSVPSKQPAFARYHVGSFNVTNYVLEVEGDRVNKSVSKEDFIFSKYGLKLETALDGKTITVIKDKNYKQGTEIIPISNAPPVLQLNGQISSKQLKKQNKKNKQFFKDLGIDISDENKYEIIHLAEDSTNSEYQIRTAVRNNKPLIIYPYLYPDFTEALKNKDYETLYFLLKDLGIKTVNFTSSYANILTKDVIDTFNLNLKKSVREVLKNAIVHGNLTDLTLPIVIKFDEQNFKIDVFNQNIQTKQEDKILKNITAAVDWTGEGDGIKDMQSYTTLEYSDNNNNNDTRKPTDKIWQTTIQKKINYKKEIRNKMHKIDIEDDTIELLLENIISIPDNELLKILDKNKSEILKMLFEEFEKTKTVDTFDPYDENTLIAEMFYIVAEKNDDTCMVLKLINNKLAIIAANADDMSENYIYIDDNMKNNLIKNIKNIHVVFTNEEETKSYAEEFEHKLKQYNSDVINRLLQKNYPSIETINKMGFTEEDLINLRLDEFIKDKDTFQKNLFDNLQNGKLVALFPFASPETSAEDSIFLNRYVNDEFFKEISYYLAQQIRENSDTYFSVDYLKAILEILKNSFVHGNNISMNKPIFFYIKNGRLYITNVVDKENTASNYKKSLAVLANLTGVHYGNEYVKSHFYLEYKSSDFKELTNGDIYEASIKVGNINSIENQKMAGIKDNNLSKVYELLLKGIPPSLVNIYVVLKETLEIFFTQNSFINAHEQDRQHGAESLVKQANILKAVTTALSLSVISLSVITGTLPFLLAIQIIIGAVISMFGISAATHYYINYEFINDVKDVINKTGENIKDGIFTIKVVNKNIDEDVYVNNIKLVNSGLKINGEIVWINKKSNELVVYCKEQNYEEILPVAKNIVLKTTKANKVTEFCVDTRETAPEITEKDGITIINSSVYNELKENKISDTEIASAIKEANSMEQKANTLYSVSKNNQIFLEYEIKDDISYNNFINKVLSENLGFGYVIDIETVNKYGKDFETKIEQAKKEKNINIYIKGKDKQINFKRIENFDDIKTLEAQIEKVNFSENIPLIPASKLFSLVDKERFTDKFVMLNKLANLFFIKREYTTEYVKNLANTADEKLLKEISNYGAETVLNNLHENNIENISNLLLQNTTIKIIFKKIEKNNPQKAKELKADFIKTLAIRTLLYNLAGEQHLRNEFKEKLNYIEELFINTQKTI